MLENQLRRTIINSIAAILKFLDVTFVTKDGNFCYNGTMRIVYLKNYFNYIIQFRD